MATAPHNKSPNAKAAELRGERTWTGWRLSTLTEQVLRHNQRDVTERDLRGVGCLEYLKVKLLTPTERHHVRLRRPAPLTSDMVTYYALRMNVAERLTAAQLKSWRAALPTPEELDEMVLNLTEHLFYRTTRRSAD
ncbi:hypothetical protein GCM10027270_35260 [Nocardioides ginkgobilobae]